jgi:hypothetical protein
MPGFRDRQGVTNSAASSVHLVDDNVAIGGDPLLQGTDLGLVDDAQPAGREGDRSRDAAAAGLAIPAPAAVGRERSDVDNGRRGRQSFAEFAS